MSSKYRFNNPDGCYFVTFAVVGWVDIFTRNVYKDILIESWKYCQQKKGLLIHAYVIMTNHVHMIMSRNSKNALDDIMRDMKKFTAVKILEAIKTEPESRREWMLAIFKETGEANSNNTVYQFWQQDNHPIECDTSDILQQKMEYVHENPVRAGFVERAEDWVYSSAGDYYANRRFTTPDPYNEFHSSYVGMGNRPHMTTDPTGGFTGGTTLLNEVVITASRLPSISSVVGSIAGVAARGLMTAAITSSFSPLDDIYFKNGKEDRRIVNDQPDRYFELTRNSEFTTGYEAIEMANPNVNPSGVMYNNVSGYVYNALDIKIRNILMAKHGPTSTYIKGLEAQGNFQPLHSKNYLQYYEQKYHTRSSFYYGLENYYGPGYADVSFSGLQGARGMMRASPRTFYPRVNSVRPSLSLNPQIKNPWSQFLNATQGKYVGPNAMKQAAHDYRLWRMGKF